MAPAAVLYCGPRHPGVQLCIDGGGQRARFRFIEVGEENLCAMAREHARGRGAKAAGRTGDQGLLAGDTLSGQVGHGVAL
jgi:hypothetical protein